MTDIAAQQLPALPLPPLDLHSERVTRELNNRKTQGRLFLRAGSLCLWVIIALLYRDIAPWWAIAAPVALHLTGVAFQEAVAFLLRRERLSAEQHRRLDSLAVFSNNFAIGLAALLLVPQPDLSARFVLCLLLIAGAFVASSRAIGGRGALLAAVPILAPLGIAFLLEGGRSDLHMAAGAALALAIIGLMSMRQDRLIRREVAQGFAYEDMARRHAAAEAEMARARDRLQVVIDNMADGVVLLDRDGRWLIDSGRVRDLIGLPPDVAHVGASMEDIRQFQIARGDFADQRQLDAVERAAQEIDANGNSHYERRTSSGRIVQFKARQLANGERLHTYRDITEQREGERAIARAREELSDAIEGLADGLAVFDAELRTLVFNPEFWSVAPGLSQHDLIGRPLGDILREIVRAGSAEGYDASNADKFVAMWEAYVRNPRGYIERRDIKGRWLRYYARKTRLGHYVVGFTDISELKRREAELENARADLQRGRDIMQTVLENMTDGVLLYERDGRIAFINRRSMEFHGLEASQLESIRTLDDMVRFLEARDNPASPHEIERAAQQRAAAVRASTGDSVSFRRTPEGQYLEIRFVPVRDGAILAIHRDLTEVKKQEEELARERDDAAEARAEAARERERLEDAIRAMPSGFSMHDAEHRLVVWNHAYAYHFGGNTPGLLERGQTHETLLRRMVALGKVSAEHAAGGEAWIQEMARQHRNSLGEREMETRAGRWIRISKHGTREGGVVTLVTDLTDQRARQQETEEARARAEAARQEAEAANQAKSTFLATMSHEIRTPMNGVIGTAELLEREELSERQKRLVGTVRTSAAALLRIIDDVLDFSKIEAGRMELEEAPFSLRSLVEGTTDTLSVQAERKGLALQATIEPGMPDSFMGDAVRLRQILFNLIGNAIKFTEIGSISVAARMVEQDKSGTLLAFSVSDTGIGMGQAEVARLFLPFSQADSSTTRRYGGTGLGLSIVRRLAQLMGGDVSVRSAPGEGSTFTATFRVARATPAAAPKDVAQTVRSAAEIVVPSGACVLAVDDYETNLEVLRRQFEIIGVDLDTADDGIDALIKMRERSYALVLSDIHMPDLDGLELTRQIRAEEAMRGGRRTPVVALTANALKGEAERCIAAGMDGYLTKPLTLDRLREALSRWMSFDAPGEPAEPAAQASAEAAVDREVLKGLFGDNAATIDRVLARFAGAGAELVGAIVAARDDSRRLTDLAHKLKGAARAAGAVRLGYIAAALEVSRAAADVDAIEAEWRRVVADLKGAPRR